MATVFPTSLDALANPGPTDPRVGHASQHDNANDAIEAIETKIGIDGSLVTTSLDYLLKSTASVSPGHKHSGSEISVNTIPATAFDTNVLSGWNAFGVTLTYASATSFTVSSDWSGILAKGDRIMLTNSTLKYFYVLGAVFAAGQTTVTITGGTTYTLSNTTISSPFFSKVLSPNGHPIWFDYTPTYAGTGAMTVALNSGLTAKFKVDASSFTIVFDAVLTIGGVADFGVLVSSPITPSPSIAYTGAARAQNTGGYQVLWDASNTKVQFRKYDGGNHGLGNFSYSFQIQMQF